MNCVKKRTDDILTISSSLSSSSDSTAMSRSMKIDELDGETGAEDLCCFEAVRSECMKYSLENVRTHLACLRQRLHLDHHHGGQTGGQMRLS